MSFDDYTKILRRRLKVMLIPALLGALTGYLVTQVLTPEYTSKSLILIERPTVPQTLVPTVTTDDLFTRLATMQEQIESRTRLQPIIERYDLYKSERNRSMEDAVDEMRKAIAVQPVEFASEMAKNSRQQPVPGFSISFTCGNPRLAQQVTTELTSMFMDENLRQHEQLARGTTDFLSNQLTEAKRELDDQNAKLAAFKTRNLGTLPDEQQANLQVLATLNTQLAAQSEQLNRAQQDKAYAGSLLSQQEAAWQASQAGQASGQTSGQTPSAETPEQKLAKMKESLAILRGRYTDSYPDVVKLQHDIVQMEQQIAGQKADQEAAQEKAAAQPKPLPAASAALAPQSIQQLRAQLNQDEEFIRTATKEQEHLQEQVKLYESRLQVTPEVEQEFKKLSLGQDAALKFYDSLLASRDESQMSVSLESRGQGEQFRVLDSPSLPLSPSFPVWWEFALGGLGAGLALGLGLAALLELRDKAIRDERDVEFYLELPTLALLPALRAGEIRNGKRNLFRRDAKPPSPRRAGAQTEASL